MECNQPAEVHARAGPTSRFLAMASGNRNAVKFIGRRVRASRLSGGSQQTNNHSRRVKSGRRFDRNSRTGLHRSVANPRTGDGDRRQRNAANGPKASTALPAGSARDGV